MWRFLLAFRCFFLILFARRLPPEAAALLPHSERAPELPPPEGEILPREAPPLPASVPVAVAVAARAPAASEAAPPRPTEPLVDEARVAQRGAVQMLSLLQREGRLLDFLMEGIDSFDDAQVGAAVRDIHRGCKKALDEHVRVEPVMREPDGATVRIEEGFDASRVRLVGNVAGKPPFLGTLRHPGWRGADVRLPERLPSEDAQVIAPAEVEL